MAPVYRSVLDPISALTFAAAALRPGSGSGVAVVNLPFVSPAYLAKQASTLDVLSGGRFDLGLGTGWQTRGVHRQRRVDGTPRGARRRSSSPRSTPCGRTRSARFEGEFYTIPPSRMAPKPVQRPGPPVLLGGVGRRRAEARRPPAAGWISRSATDLTKIHEQIAVVRAAAEEAGKDPSAVRVVVRGVVRAGEEVRDESGERTRLSGSYEQIREDAAWLGEQGVTELFYDLNWDPRVGSPDVAPAEATARAKEILEALAP